MNTVIDERTYMILTLVLFLLVSAFGGWVISLLTAIPFGPAFGLFGLVLLLLVAVCFILFIL